MNRQPQQKQRLRLCSLVYQIMPRGCRSPPPLLPLTGRERVCDTKDTATVWGVVIGFAAYLAWLAVDLEEEAKVEGVEPHADQDDEESGEESGEEGEAAVRVHAHDKMD